MDQFRHSQNTNRVYINRNFNRIRAEGVAKVPNNNVMYFNPNFSHAPSTPNYIAHRDPTIRPKIHVNPNFIRPKVEDASIDSSFYVNTAVCTATNTCNQVSYTQPIQTVFVDRKTIPMPTVSNSRYCLVRQNEQVVKTPVMSLPVKYTQQTVKVNKYKLVSLNSVKKSLTASKKPITKPIQMKLNQSIIKSKYKLSTKSALIVQNNRFRFTKRNSTANASETLQGMVRRVSTHNKNILKTSIRKNKKIVTGSLKKNNIPCPLFRKYGKCLRMTQGSCDYLHDKKHVSICRKFLKGVCHNKHCLLSHDLTDKKMPTCYFYLQGNCTKEGCPYLHVKLNEKTKICPNFLKGYCENGDKCVHRHVNTSFNHNTKLNQSRKYNSSTKINKNFLQRAKASVRNTGKEDSKPNKESSNNINKEIIKDQRYFKEVSDKETSEEQNYDLIKPIRCKLGILPSFIQL